MTVYNNDPHDEMSHKNYSVHSTTKGEEQSGAALCFISIVWCAVMVIGSIVLITG